MKKFKYLRDNIRRIEKEKKKKEKHGSKRTEKNLRNKLLNTLEKKGDVLVLLGKDEDGKECYLNILDRMESSNPIRQARLIRKTAPAIKVFKLGLKEGLERYQEAENILSECATHFKDDKNWWQEWIALHFERGLTYYGMNQPDKMVEIVQKIKVGVENFGTLEQKANLFFILSNAEYRRTRYVTSEKALSYAKKLLLLAEHSGNLQEIAKANFELGFSFLFYGDFHNAKSQTQKSLKLSRKTGDALLQCQSLNYLAISCRRLLQIQETEEHALKALKISKRINLEIYQALAEGNLSWVELQKGNFDTAERRAETALKLWGDFPFPFQWVALFTLIQLHHSRKQPSILMDCVKRLIAPTQQKLPTVLTEQFEKAVKNYEKNNITRAFQFVEKALETAKTLTFI
jgi:tetratricopeptide (TPR) repeat protein